MIDHRKRLILYVDDTVEQRYAMRRILETAGFHVLEAGTGKGALAQLSASIDLAVVDVRLPDISGYELSTRMKERQPNLPILQVSASFSDPDLRAAGLSGGADAYIAQPIHPVELTSLIRRMLRTAEAEESLRFLASIGPILSTSLAIEETVHNIQRVIVPTFADYSAVYLASVSVETGFFWTDSSKSEDRYRSALKEPQQSHAATMVDKRHIIVPLQAGGKGLGSILFGLDGTREYTKTDLVMAADLSNRAGLALQNCLLFASEQLTQSALIQSEKLATAGRMSAAIAHEINNPLEALTNLIYIIEQSADVPEPIREVATAALAEVTRLAHITRQSLGFYRELRAPSFLDLSESVQDAVELYSKRIKSSNIKLSLELGDSLKIKGIKGEIRQIISNLLVNALEVTPDGGVLRIQTAATGEMARFVIEDHGPGVDAAIESQIFEPFFTTKKGTGTGLGLWITKSIVEKHGGTIGFKSLEGNGSGACFIVEFPLVDE